MLADESKCFALFSCFFVLQMTYNDTEFIWIILKFMRLLVEMYPES